MPDPRTAHTTVSPDFVSIDRIIDLGFYHIKKSLIFAKVLPMIGPTRGGTASAAGNGTAGGGRRFPRQLGGPIPVNMGARHEACILRGDFGTEAAGAAWIASRVPSARGPLTTAAGVPPTRPRRLP